MKTLYIECKMGVAGDMLMAALSEHVDAQAFVGKMNSLNLEGVEFALDTIKRCGIEGTKANVLINGVKEGDSNVNVHSHTGINDIESIINNLDLPDKVRSDSIAVYNSIAEAESIAHGVKVSDIHFHEVGTMDSIADVVGVCLLMNMISPDKVVTTPVNVGGGMVRTSHGIVPVPAPATSILLEGIPMYTDSKIDTELCTPTGAALIKYFTDDFGNCPGMKMDRTGYGFGTKDFSDRGILNCVRTFTGEAITEAASDSDDRIIELNCNIDDMTPEDIGYVMEKLLSDGAADVFTTPIYMKKNRPGVLLTVLCKEDMRDKMVKEIFVYTTTIGVREKICERYVLERHEVVKNTAYGDVRYKEVQGYGVKRAKPEYEDVIRVAEERGIAPTRVREDI